MHTPPCSAILRASTDACPDPATTIFDPKLDTTDSDPSIALVAWSGGKDCTLALREALADPAIRVAGLLTTVTEDHDRVTMHGVRRSLLHAQARSLGLPLFEVAIPRDCPNAVYEQRMSDALRAQSEERGVGAVVYGDLFLADVRAYRERQLEPLGLRSLFPLWQRDTAAVARRFIDDGFRALLCVIDPRQLDPSFVGREYDHPLLRDLPETADPCGENGEFHTFVHGGPLFRQPLGIERGEIVQRGGFWFCDLRATTLEGEPADHRPKRTP